MSIHFCKPGDSNQLQDSYCQFCFIFLNVMGNMHGTSKRPVQLEDGNGTISLCEMAAVIIGCSVMVIRGQGARGWLELTDAVLCFAHLAFQQL